jgi:hypothetical protein
VAKKRRKPQRPQPGEGDKPSDKQWVIPMVMTLAAGGKHISSSPHSTYADNDPSMVHEVTFPTQRSAGRQEKWRVEISSKYGPIRAWYAGPLTWDMVHTWYRNVVPPLEEFANVEGSRMENVEFTDSDGNVTLGYTVDKEIHLLNGADEIEYWYADYSNVNGAEAFGKLPLWRGEHAGDPKSYFDDHWEHIVPVIDLPSGEYVS